MEREVLEALLHDIGKFMQRTELKEYKGKRHAELSENFLKTLLGLGVASTGSIRLHHMPSYKSHFIVAIADKLSASERQNLEEEEDKQEGSRWKRVLNSVVLSPLSESERPLVSLDLEGIESIVGGELIRGPEGYKSLWSGNDDKKGLSSYLKIVKKIDEGNMSYDKFLKIFYLLKKYTSFIPSAAYRSKPTISLFHHLALSAAFATVLTKLKDVEDDSFFENLHNFLRKNGSGEDSQRLEITPEEREAANKKVFAIIAGDLSGIQKFVSNIPSKQAARQLRSRSIYLRILMMVVEHYILDRLGLNESCILTSGGGRFWILAPNTGEVEDVIKEIKKKIYEIHGPSLYLALVSEAFSANDFCPEEEYDRGEEERWIVLKRIGRGLSEDKHRRLSSILLDGGGDAYENVFGPYNKGLCRKCGALTMSSNLEDDLCFICKSIESLGSLSGAKYLCKVDRSNSYAFKKGKSDRYLWSRRLVENFGFSYEFRDRINDNEFEEVYSLGPDEFDPKAHSGFVYFALPERVEFEKLANLSEGAKRLGLVMLDVDRLGDKVNEILKRSKDKLASFISFSDELQLFFEYYVPHKIEKLFGKGNYYLVYSGGDDLVFVAPWDKLLERIDDLRKSISMFSNRNLDVSGGIVMFKTGWPIRRVYSLVSEEESKAKKFRDRLARDDVTTGCIGLYGYPLPWEDTKGMMGFSSVKEKKNELLNLCVKKNLSKSFLRVIMNFGESHTTSDESGGKILKWWFIDYLIGRGVFKGADDFLKEFRDKVRRSISGNTNSVLALAIAARWVYDLKPKKLVEGGEEFE